MLKRALCSMHTNIRPISVNMSSGENKKSIFSLFLWFISYHWHLHIIMYHDRFDELGVELEMVENATNFSFNGL